MIPRKSANSAPRVIDDLVDLAISRIPDHEPGAASPEPVAPADPASTGLAAIAMSVFVLLLSHMAAPIDRWLALFWFVMALFLLFAGTLIVCRKRARLDCESGERVDS